MSGFQSASPTEIVHDGSSFFEKAVSGFLGAILSAKVIISCHHVSVSSELEEEQKAGLQAPSFARCESCSDSAIISYLESWQASSGSAVGGTIGVFLAWRCT